MVWGRGPVDAGAVLSVREVSDLLGVSPQRVRQTIGDGQLPARRTTLAGSFPGSRWSGGLTPRRRGIDPPRATEDIDVVVDIRSRKDSIRRLRKWLEQAGFAMVGPNPYGIGHRYVQPLATGGGKVSFDVLAPDYLGARSDLTTTPPARTVEAPGGKEGDRGRRTDSCWHRLTDGHGASTLVARRDPSQGAATTIAVRANP
jgi:hypothetical protein